MSSVGVRLCPLSDMLEGTVSSSAISLLIISPLKPLNGWHELNG